MGRGTRAAGLEGAACRVGDVGFVVGRVKVLAVPASVFGGYQFMDYLSKDTGMGKRDGKMVARRYDLRREHDRLPNTTQARPLRKSSRIITCARCTTKWLLVFSKAAMTDCLCRLSRRASHRITNQHAETLHCQHLLHISSTSEGVNSKLQLTGLKAVTLVFPSYGGI